MRTVLYTLIDESGGDDNFYLLLAREYGVTLVSQQRDDDHDEIDLTITGIEAAIDKLSAELGLVPIVVADTGKL